MGCIRSSPTYKGARRPAELRMVTCEICGKTTSATTNRDVGDRRQKTCLSDKCREEVARRRRQRYRATDHGKAVRALRPSEARCRIYVRDCAECERLFVARSSRTKLCSDVCRRRYLIKQVLDRHYGYVATGMPKRSLLDYLFKRDGGKCGICRKPVREKGGPMRPSIDHIWPRSLGGSDELGNLQLAHYQCNLDKGNRAGHEQPLLVG